MGGSKDGVGVSVPIRAIVIYMHAPIGAIGPKGQLSSVRMLTTAIVMVNNFDVFTTFTIMYIPGTNLVRVTSCFNSNNVIERKSSKCM